MFILMEELLLSVAFAINALSFEALNISLQDETLPFPLSFLCSFSHTTPADEPSPSCTSRIFWTCACRTR